MVFAALCIALPLVSSRMIFGRTLGPNCTVRVEQRECITNPLFMERDCHGDCNLINAQLVDTDSLRCRRNARLCFTRNDAIRDKFVYQECPRTCEHQYRTIEQILAPGDLQVLMHACLPTFYSLVLLALMGWQAIIACSGPLMMALEKIKRNKPSFASLAERGQALLISICENQDQFKTFGPQPVGRLFVCGYYVVEGGFILGIMAVLVFVGPKVGSVSARPKFLNTCDMMLFFYSFMEAFLNLLKGLILESTPSEKLEEHHVIIDAAHMIKKIAMLGVAMLFLQTSKVMPEKKQTSVLDAAAGLDERSQVQDTLLLIGRLLLAGLFCFVGLVESRRVLSGNLHDPPDGNDILWPKMVQLLLVVPFILGYKTKWVTQLLAVMLVVEAVTIWTFWRELFSDLPTMFHALQCKDHFATNVAIAGGLFLLQEEEGGKYTLDAYMKKKD